MSSGISQSFNQDASGNISRPSSYTTGTLTALNQAVSVTVPEGDSSWVVYLNGTFSATSQVAFEGSLDNTNWFYLNGRRNTDATTNDINTTIDATPPGGAAPTGANPSGWRGNLAGAKFMRVRCSLYTTSDSIAVQISTSVATGAVFLNASLPTFADKIGTTTITAVNGTAAGITIGCSSLVFNVTGTWVATLVIEGTVDGTNWGEINGFAPTAGSAVSGGGFSINGMIAVQTGGFQSVRLRASAFTSGTVNVAWESSAGTNASIAYNPFPAALQSTTRLNDGSGNAITSSAEGSKIRLDVSTGVALTGSAPASASIGVASTAALAANSSRRGLIMVNTSNARISLNIAGGTAVLNTGITLYPGGTWSMDDYSFTTSAITAIASVAASNLAIQELS